MMTAMFPKTAHERSKSLHWRVYTCAPSRILTSRLL